MALHLTKKVFDAYLGQVLEDALRLYGPRRLVGSYNGGKDAVVIMHLQRYASMCFVAPAAPSRKKETTEVVYVSLSFAPRVLLFTFRVLYWCYCLT